MLMEFKVENYKTFFDEATFSMIAAPRQSGLSYSITPITLGKKC